MKRKYKIRIGDDVFIMGNKKTLIAFIRAHLHLSGHSLEIKVID